MFGAYYSDPNAQVYSPEKIGDVPKSKEKGELSPEQQAKAEQWATMANEVLEGGAQTARTPENPETPIPETEPVLQAQAEENMTQSQLDMAAAEAAATEAQIRADQEAMNGEDGEEEYEEVEEDYTDENGKPAKRKVRRPKNNGKGMKPGTPVQGMGAEATVETMAAMSPAGAIMAEAVDQALEYTKQGVNDIDGPDAGGDGSKKEDGDKDGKKVPGVSEEALGEAIEDTAEETETPAGASAGIQHFSQEGVSSFNPLSPEEQQAQQKAAAKAEASKRYDDDNLVAEAVSAGSGEGTIDLNGVGGKLEGQGIGIQDEVEKMKADTAKDIALAGGDETESTIAPAQTADNLAVDTGAQALAIKEQAADVKAAIEDGTADADSIVAEFTQSASETEQLADIAESASVEAGEQVSETIGEARKMTEEAKEAVEEAKTEAETSEEGEGEGDDEEDGENSTFNSDKYPELAGLDNGDRKSIFM